MYKRIMVTGSAGFIGSNFVIKYLEKYPDSLVVSVDRFSKGSSLLNLKPVIGNPGHKLYKTDIGNKEFINHLLHKYHIEAVINFAAESHVDRSIDAPESFIESNVVSCTKLMSECMKYMREKHITWFKYINVSTDEVYGALAKEDPAFSEDNKFLPNSPYAASKASVDLIARSFHKTFGFPVITTHCSNNYGPRQNEEKLLPKVIKNILFNKPIPVYGNGEQIREWLPVDVHCDVILKLLENGKVGDSYNIGCGVEMQNLDLIKMVNASIQRVTNKKRDLNIEFVADRLGHDFRYSIDFSKIKKNINYKFNTNMEEYLDYTVSWYFDLWKEQLELEGL